MKKLYIYASISIFMLLVFWVKPVLAVSIANIPIGTPQTSLDQLVGKPTQTTQENGLTVLWYGSNTATFADIVYVQDGKVVKTSVSLRESKTTLSIYLTKWGNPEQSYNKYSDTLADSLQLRVHIWPTRGKAIITSGQSPDSPVVSEDTFTPTTLQGYLAGWGKDLVGNSVATISGTKSFTPVSTVKPSPRSPVTLYVVYGVGISVIMVIIVYLWRKRRKVMPL